MQTTRWEANDPLVHYLTDDLRVFKYGTLTNDSKGRIISPPSKATISITDDSSIGSRNRKYRPWGGNDQLTEDVDLTASDYRVKDAGVRSSDDWDFPTNKLPSLGWLGRIHRGTPWQTMYLKAYPTNDLQGNAFQGDWMMDKGGPGLSFEAHPTNDWRMLDLFTVALHPNATRGQLSVNQTNLPAWSAVLAGVTATTFVEPDPNVFVPVDTNVVPAAIQGQLQYIFDGISRARSLMPSNRFEHIADILAAPELTTASPFLIPTGISARWSPKDQAEQLRDIDYERIPDQIMSLLRVGDPRFVIYSFGQSLKPEYVDPATGLALNYQITGEVATRSIIRVEYDGLPGSKYGRYTGPDVHVTDPDDLGGPDVNRPHIVVEQFNILPPE